MRTLLLAIVASAGLVALIAPQVAAAGRQVNDESAAALKERSTETLKAFSDRVDAYCSLRDRVEAKLGPVPETAEPAVITSRQRSIGRAVRGARSGARQGDLFTSDVASLIRKLIAGDLSRRDPVERRAFLVSQPDITVHVNDFYPSTVPLATVPPRILAALPRLPQGMQYRFVGTNLILFDVDSNLVVDVLPEAVPARYRAR
jgi:hypothetical protein